MDDAEVVEAVACEAIFRGFESPHPPLTVGSCVALAR